MILRDQAVDEMKGWIRAKAEALDIKALKRTPTAPAKLYPAVFIHEGDDRIERPAKRSWHGYPVDRVAEVIVELWVLEEDERDIREFFQQIRNILFAEKLSNSCTLRELRAFGPFNGGATGVVCMQMVFALGYKDQGPSPLL